MNDRRTYNPATKEQGPATRTGLGISRPNPASDVCSHCVCYEHGDQCCGCGGTNGESLGHAFDFDFLSDAQKTKALYYLAGYAPETARIVYDYAKATQP